MASGACIIKLFVINSRQQKARVFVAHRYVHPCLICAVKAGAYSSGSYVTPLWGWLPALPSKGESNTVRFKNGREKFYYSGPSQRKMADSYWSLIKGECLFAKWSDANRIIWKIEKERNS
jgi:hypothetical protein